MDQQFKTGVIIEGDNSGAVKAIDVFRQALDQANAKAVEHQKILRESQASLAELSSGFSEAARTALEFAGVGFGLEAVKSFSEGLIEADNDLASLKANLNLALGSDAAKGLELISSEAQRLGLNFQSAASDFVKLEQAASGTSLSGRGAAQLFTGVNEAVTALHLSAEQATAVFDTLDKTVGTGTVSFKDLTSIGKEIPGIFSIAAQVMGKTDEQLKAAIGSGGQLADDILPKIAAALHNTYGDAASKEADNLVNNTNRLKTSFSDLKDSLNESGGDSLFNSGTKGLTTFIQQITAGIRASSEFAKTNQQTGTQSVSYWEAFGQETVLFFGRIPSFVKATIEGLTNEFAYWVTNVGLQFHALSLVAQGAFANIVQYAGDAFAGVLTRISSVLSGAGNLADKLGFGSAMVATLQTSASQITAISANIIASGKQRVDQVHTEESALVSAAAVNESTHREAQVATAEEVVSSEALRSEYVYRAGALASMTAEQLKASEARLRATAADQAAAEAIEKANAAALTQNSVLAREIQLIQSGLPLQQAQTRAQLESQGIAEATIQTRLRLNAALEAFSTAQQAAKKAQADAAENAKKDMEEYNKALSDQLAINDQLKAKNDAVADLQSQLDLINQGVSAQQAAYQVEQDRLAVNIALAQAQGDSAKASLLQGQVDQNNLKQQITAAGELTAYLDSKPFATSVSEIRKALGSLGDPLLHLVDGFTQMSKVSDDAAKAQQKAIADGLTGTALQNAQQLIAQKELIAQVGVYGELAGAAQDFFAKGSEGYKAMGAISKVFHVAELAMEAEKQFAAAKTALISALEAPPPASFVAYAAVAAMIAGLGIALGGSGGSSTTPGPNDTTVDYGSGKGTTLGDITAQSASIANGLDHLQAYANKGLDFAQQQLNQLTAINNGINGLGTLLYQTNIAAGGASPFNTPGSTFVSAAGGDPLLGKITLGPLGDVINKVTSTVSDLIKSIPVIGQIGGVLGNITDSIAGALFGHTSVEQSASGLEFGADSTVKQAVSGQSVADYYATIRTHDSGGLFGSSSTSYDDQTAGLDAQTSEQIRKIIAGLGQTVIASVTELGGNVSQAQAELDALPLDIGKVNLQGLTGDALQKQISAVFSALGDRLAGGVENAIGGITLDKFQQAGEGLMNTLIRVSSDFEYASSVSTKLHLPIATLTDAMADQADVASALIKTSVDLAETSGGVESGIGLLSDSFSGTASDLVSFVTEMYDVRRAMVDVGSDGARLNETLVNAAGGLDALKSGLQAYFSAFLTSDQQTAAEGADLTKTLGQLGLSLPATRAGFESLIQGLDLTTSAGQTAYGTLIAISGDFDTYYKGVEQQASDALAAANAALAAQNKLIASMKSFAESSAGVAAGINGLASQFNTASALNALGGASTFDDRASAGSSLEQLVAQQYNDQVTAITGARDTQIAAINTTLQAQLSALNTQAQTQSSINQQVAQAQQQDQQAALAAYQKMQSAAQGLLAFANQLGTSTLAPGTPLDQLAANKDLFESLVTKAKGGDSDAAGQIAQQGQALLTLGQQIYGSAQPFRELYAEVKNTSLNTAGVLSSRAAPSASPEVAALQALQAQSTQTNDILNAQIAAANSAAQGQIDAINAQSDVALAELKDQSLAALSDIENAVLTGNIDLGSLIDAITLGNAQQAGILQAQLSALESLDAGIAANITSGAALPHFADGGIADSPSILGEAGPEAAIPLKHGSVPVHFDSSPMQAIVGAIQELQRQMANQQQSITVQVVTPDGKTIVDQTLTQLKSLSQRGHPVIYAAGIQGRKRA